MDITWFTAAGWTTTTISGCSTSIGEQAIASHAIRESTSIPSGPGTDPRSIFSSIRDDGFHLYQKGATAAATESLLLAKPPRAKVATDWSAQDFVLFQSLEFDSGYDIFALPMSGDRVPIPVVQSQGDDRDAQFSPDGKWIAYSSDESGRNEVYIQAFPKAGRRFGPISKGGGAQPRWRADGKELFYLSRDGHLMSVQIQLSTSRRRCADANAAVCRTRASATTTSTTIRRLAQG